MSVVARRSGVKMVETLAESASTHVGWPCYCYIQLLKRQVVADGAIEGSY